MQSIKTTAAEGWESVKEGASNAYNAVVPEKPLT